jgi:hypothetical protein
MNNSQNLASLRSSIFTSLSIRGKFQSMTKLQNLGRMKISEASPNQYTILIQTTVVHQKIWRRILEQPHKKDIREPLTKDSRRAAKEAACQIRVEVVAEAEAPTHSNLCTACTMTTKLSIAPKIVQSSFCRKEKWTKILQSLHSKPHPRSQPHHAMGSSPSAIFFVLSFIVSITTLSEHPSTTSGILPILPLCHNQSPATFANSLNNIPSTSSTNNIYPSSFVNHLPSAEQHPPQVKTTADPPPPPLPQIQELQ